MSDTATPLWLSQIPSWRDEPAALQIPTKADVVVIGGGIMGVTTAYWLARARLSVIVLEASELGSGASGRNVGLMLHGSSTLESSALAREVLTAEKIESEYECRGHLALASSNEIWERICAEVAARADAVGSLRALTRRECNDLLGMKISSRFRGGRWLPGGASIHPGRFLYGCAQAARRHGACILVNTPVRSVYSRSRLCCSIVETTTMRIRANAVVYATGAATPQLLPSLSPLIRRVRAHVVCTSPMPKRFAPGMAVDWGTVYWRQLGDGTVVLGGNPLRSNNHRTSTESSIFRALRRFLPDAFPGLPNINIVNQWRGVMDQTPDQRPIAGRLPGTPNAWLLFGFGGHGLPPSLGFSRQIADSILADAVTPLLAPYSAERFENRRVS